MTAPATASPPTIRPAHSSDLAAVEELLVASALPTDGVAEMFAREPGDFVLAEVRDAAGRPTLAGVAGLEVLGEDALLRSVAVRPEWQGRGVGRDLVRELLREAERRELRTLYLLTTTAEHYFPRFGFAPVDRASVPEAVRESAEFRIACPASAIAMAKVLRGG